MAETNKNDVVLSVKDLHVYFYTNQRCNKVLRGVSFDIKRGKTLCVVGESGCGKSVTANSILRLLPELSRIESGSITYYREDGSEVRIDQLQKNGREMRRLRGQDIAIIFQDPMTALNPVYTVEEGVHRGSGGYGNPGGGDPRRGISAPVLWGHAAARYDRHGHVL